MEEPGAAFAAPSGFTEPHAGQHSIPFDEVVMQRAAPGVQEEQGNHQASAYSVRSARRELMEVRKGAWASTEDDWHRTG